MHRRNSREEGRELLSEHRSTKYKRSTMYPVYVTFVYEITRHMTLVDRKGLKKRIEKAVRDVNKILEHDADYFTFIKIKQMLAFKNPGRPLKRYTASELSRLLRNNAFFKKYSKNIKSDTTQVLLKKKTACYKFRGGFLSSKVVWDGEVLVKSCSMPNISSEGAVAPVPLPVNRFIVSHIVALLSYFAFQLVASETPDYKVDDDDYDDEKVNSKSQGLCTRNQDFPRLFSIQGHSAITEQKTHFNTKSCLAM